MGHLICLTIQYLQEILQGLHSQAKFGDTQAFDLKDESGNKLLHMQSLILIVKTIVLTYTDYVENHSNVKGNFYARVDTKVIKENQTIPVSLTIENEVVIPAKYRV